LLDVIGVGSVDDASPKKGEGKGCKDEEFAITHY
jgi:hypothetical protein